MKTKLLFIALFIVLFISPSKLNATITGVVNIADGINIRSSAEVTNDNVIKAIRYNSSITLVDSTLYSGTGCSNGWYKIIFDNNYGYVCSDFVTITSSENSNVIYYTGDYQAKVNTSSFISVRESASASSSLIERIITGTHVNIISTWPAGNGCEKEWYYVTYYNGKKGYVCSSYIYKKSELTINEEDYTEEEKTYVESLKTLGFYDSYIPYLVKMHRDHPNWNFTPSKNNIIWDDLISNEQGKNKIESSTVSYSVLPYYVSSMTGTEGGSWYYTNDAVNAYFLDPRNFLSDRFIFIFEDVSYYEEYQTASAVKTMFDVSRPNSFLNTDEYISFFMQAAVASNISPLHLVARVIKEGSSSETYVTVSGLVDNTYNGCNLKGYYNFYNIGSTGSAGPYGGLFYAAGQKCDSTSTNSYGRPWENRKDAIIGGAAFIAGNYLDSGQNTLYFQKFNTANKPFFTNQYMTNIMAPTQEGENTYYTYRKLDILNNAYTFIIPIYENMPDNVALPSLANTDNTLSSIKINGKLVENFDPDVIEYNHYVTNDTSIIELVATPTISTSTVLNTGSVELNDETTQINIIVTAESGDAKTYKLNIIKVASVTSIKDIIEKLSVKVNDTSMGNISENTNANDLITSIKKADPNAKVIYKSNTGETIQSSSILSTGQTISITSSNQESKTFNIVVRGDTSGDGKITILDLLKVQKHLLNANKLDNAYALAADTNDDNNITILDLLRVQKHLLGDLKL